MSIPPFDSYQLRRYHQNLVDEQQSMQAQQSMYERIKSEHEQNKVLLLLEDV
jgi:hypothetical protein